MDYSRTKSQIMLRAVIIGALAGGLMELAFATTVVGKIVSVSVVVGAISFMWTRLGQRLQIIESKPDSNLDPTGRF